MVNLVDPVESLRITLPCCENIEQFAVLVESHPAETIENAIALADSQPKRNQLTEWFEQLSQESVGRGAELAQEEEAIATYPTLESYAEGDEVWAYFPQSEAKWLRATVEWVRDRMVRVKSGFLGRLIERENAIAPGSWVMSG